MNNRKNKSLSIYCRKEYESCTNFNRNGKEYSTENMRRQQLCEVGDIKTAFSKNNIKCGMNTLMESLVSPTFDKAKIYKLPLFGDGLPADPRGRKAKKGGKKKKGKK